MKNKKLIILLLTIISCAVFLCACGNNDSGNTATNDESPTKPVETITETTEAGLISKSSEIKVIAYDATIKNKYETPTDVGACVFSILTTKQDKKVVSTNIYDNKSLSNAMKKYSSVLKDETFNITYDESTKELKYSVCDFVTTYTFGSNVEMYMISSPLFDKNTSYLIENMVYDNDGKNMYVFLKKGWDYYEEAHAEEDELILKDGVKKANGATLLFFNELNENINPKKYIFIMPQ